MCGFALVAGRDPVDRLVYAAAYAVTPRGISLSTDSAHATALRDAGLVESHRHGKSVEVSGSQVLGEEIGDVVEDFLGGPAERGRGVAEHGREVAVLGAGQHVPGALHALFEQGGVQQ